MAGGRDERVTDLFFVDATSEGNPDEEGLVRYVNNDLVGFIDGSVVSLTTGTGLSEAQHKILRQLIHFIDDGPAEGFTSGAYKETTPTGPFPTSEIWYESSSKLKKIVSLATTWTVPVITQEVWDIYDTDGSTSLVTITDTISYSGIFETSRTRAIVVH